MRNIRDVLRLKAAGMSKRKIAVALGIGATAAVGSAYFTSAGRDRQNRQNPNISSRYFAARVHERLPVINQSRGCSHMINATSARRDRVDERLAVSPTEAARMAGIGRTKLYEAVGSGALASFKIGTRRLIRIAALEAWLAAQEAGSSCGTRGGPRAVSPERAKQHGPCAQREAVDHG